MHKKGFTLLDDEGNARSRGLTEGLEGREGERANKRSTLVVNYVFHSKIRNYLSSRFCGLEVTNRPSSDDRRAVSGRPTQLATGAGVKSGLF